MCICCLDIDPNLSVALQLWGKMVGHLLLCILLFQTIEAKDGARLPPQTTKKWMTLNGRMKLTVLVLFVLTLVE